MEISDSGNSGNHPLNSELIVSYPKMKKCPFIPSS